MLTGDKLIISPDEQQQLADRVFDQIMLYARLNVVFNSSLFGQSARLQLDRYSSQDPLIYHDRIRSKPTHLLRILRAHKKLVNMC